MPVLPDEYIPDVKLPRFPQDKRYVNNNGLLLLEFCKQTGLRIMNGRVGNDCGVGRYTFVGSKGSSLVDYVLASQDFFKFIDQFEVHEPNILSDHCLISFSFVFNEEQTSEPDDNEYEQVQGKYVWKNDFKDAFITSLSQDENVERLNVLNFRVQNYLENVEIDRCLSDLANIFETVASPVFKKMQKTKPKPSFSNELDNPWYDKRCAEKKITFYVCSISIGV